MILRLSLLPFDGEPFDGINVIIPPLLSSPLRVRRQGWSEGDDFAPVVTTGYTRLNYYGYTDDGRNVSYFGSFLSVLVLGLASQLLA